MYAPPPGLACACVVTHKQKLALLAGLPCFERIAPVELEPLARQMKPRLVGRYQKVQRAVRPPQLFQVVVFGELRSIDNRGNDTSLGPGDSFGEGALADFEAEDLNAEVAPPELVDVQVKPLRPGD